jgi:hypothetical protein
MVVSTIDVFWDFVSKDIYNNIACFQGLHLFSVQFDVFVLLWSASISQTDDLV